MKKAIINYTRKSAGTVTKIAAGVSDKLYTAGIFNTPPVTRASLDAQISVAAVKITEADGRDRKKLAELRAEKKILCGMLRQLATYVNTTVTDGDEAKLLSSGFEIHKNTERGQKPSAIEKIAAAYTNLTGIIDVSWKRARHARYYRVYISADNGMTWTLLDTVFGRKMLVEQLVSGKRYQFKVVPVGVHGAGAESSVASQIAA